MGRRFIIFIAFFMIGGLSCNTLLNNTNKTVSVYKLPFSDSNYFITYYVRVTIDGFKQYPNIEHFTVNNREFYTLLNDYISNIDTLSASRKLNDVDIRLLIEYRNQSGALVQLGLGETGVFTVNGEVYDPDDHLMEIITKYTNIKWQHGWIKSE